MIVGVLKQSIREVRALGIITSGVLLVMQVSGQAKIKVGDACQLSQSVQACTSLAGAKSSNSAGLYVSFAVSEAYDAVGIAHGQSSKNDAEQVALANCKAVGGKSCEVQHTDQGTCVGFAVGILANSAVTLTKLGFGWNNDRATAGAQALADCAKTVSQGCMLYATPCAGDNAAYPSRLPLPSGGKPGSVDPAWVGTWEIDIPGANGGRWVWQVGSGGTYELHSEAFDGTPTNVGTVAAGGGHYTLHATNVAWDDSGTYVVSAPGTLTATGKLGTGTWRKISGEDE